jgi:hypothetical protein
VILPAEREIDDAAHVCLTVLRPLAVKFKNDTQNRQDS